MYATYVSDDPLILVEIYIFGAQVIFVQSP